MEKKGGKMQVLFLGKNQIVFCVKKKKGGKKKNYRQFSDCLQEWY